MAVLKNNKGRVLEPLKKPVRTRKSGTIARSLLFTLGTTLAIRSAGAERTATFKAVTPIGKNASNLGRTLNSVNAQVNQATNGNALANAIAHGAGLVANNAAVAAFDGALRLVPGFSNENLAKECLMFNQAFRVKQKVEPGYGIVGIPIKKNKIVEEIEARGQPGSRERAQICRREALEAQKLAQEFALEALKQEAEFAENIAALNAQNQREAVNARIEQYGLDEKAAKAYAAAIMGEANAALNLGRAANKRAQAAQQIAGAKFRQEAAEEAMKGGVVKGVQKGMAAAGLMLRAPFNAGADAARGVVRNAAGVAEEAIGAAGNLGEAVIDAAEPFLIKGAKAIMSVIGSFKYLIVAAAIIALFQVIYGVRMAGNVLLSPFKLALILAKASARGGVSAFRSVRSALAQSTTAINEEELTLRRSDISHVNRQTFANATAADQNAARTMMLLMNAANAQ